MARIFTFILLLICLISLAKVKEIKPSSEIFSYIGRFDLSSIEKVKFAHSGNQIEFQFKGKCFEIGLNDLNSESSENKNFFSVIINGKVCQLIESTSFVKFHEIKVNSPDSFATIEIFKRTEALCAVAVFHGIRFYKGVFRKKAPKKRRIEWIGDSFLVGYGNLVSIEAPPLGNPSTGFHAINQNSYLAFGSIVSRYLRADFSCVGVSGKGVYRNFDQTEDSTLPKIYSKLYPGAKDIDDYDFKFNPHLIVIKIGTNDFGGEMTIPPSMTDSSIFVSTYLKFLKYVTEKNPNSKIVLALGGGITDLYPDGMQRLSRFRVLVKKVNEIASENFSNTFGFFEFKTQDPPYGEDWHPTVISQHKFASEITPYLRQFMKW